MELSIFSSCTKVQSIVFEFFPKKLVNFSNCEFDKTGLFNTKIFSFVSLSKSKILPKFPNLVFKLITLFSLRESIGGLVT